MSRLEVTRCSSQVGVSKRMKVLGVSLVYTNHTTYLFLQLARKNLITNLFWFVLLSTGERGQCVLDTPPKILFCDLRLDPGESKTCTCLYVWFFYFRKYKCIAIYGASLYCHFSDSYSEIVPGDGPPSFRGQSVKYVYKLTIGCQRVNSPIKLLRVPFRVLVLQGEMIV